MECVIKNKDIEVAYFDSDKELNKITFFIFLNKEKAPLYLQRGGDLEEWLKSRVSPEYRVNINDVLARLIRTRGVSLTDTFSVKCDFVKSNWSSYNPYTERLLELKHVDLESPYNKVAADDILGGSFEKRWVSDWGVISILKYGTGRFARNSDNEPTCEEQAYSLAKYLGMNVADYKRMSSVNREVTITPSFCNEDIGMISLEELGYNPISYRELYDIAEKNGWSTDYVWDMALIDFLTVNIDRHLGNIGLLVRNATQTIIGFTPMYDFNLALLPYYIPGEMSIDEYLEKKEYSMAYWQEPWKYLAIQLRNSAIGSSVYNKINLARKFEFTVGSEERCNIANAVLKHQLAIL